MDNFELYHKFSEINDILCGYKYGESIVCEINGLLEQLSKKTYRVAVIGEFKKGKSSLLNALLGTSILPTDILPATAVITKIVYDTEERIEIHYKNGNVEKCDVETLKDYATKLDEQKEKTASNIQEIVIHFPSVLCQNHIELIDTPGLNEASEMTEKTLAVLEKIDTAIVVISAMMPLSITEQNLICKLIEQKHIYHLTFVITFIDRVSDEAEEQDRVVEMICKRLEEDTYNMFVNAHSENTELMNKANEILKSPVIFAVSSKLAMQGFIKNDNKMLKESRFPIFKEQLLKRLTAKQDVDIWKKAKTIAGEVDGVFNEGVVFQNSQYSLLNCINNRLMNGFSKYKDQRLTQLVSYMQIMDDNLSQYVKKGALVEAINPNSCFIKHLSALTRENYTPQSIINAVGEGVKEFNSKMSYIDGCLVDALLTEMDAVEQQITNMDAKYGIQISNKVDKEKFSYPQKQLTVEWIVQNIDNIYGNIIPQINNICVGIIEDYYSALMNYMSSWRVSLFMVNEEAVNALDSTICQLQSNIAGNVKRISKFGQNVVKDREEALEITKYIVENC